MPIKDLLLTALTFSLCIFSRNVAIAEIETPNAMYHEDLLPAIVVLLDFG